MIRCAQFYGRAPASGASWPDLHSGQIPQHFAEHNRASGAHITHCSAGVISTASAKSGDGSTASTGSGHSGGYANGRSLQAIKTKTPSKAARFNMAGSVSEV